MLLQRLVDSEHKGFGFDYMVASEYENGATTITLQSLDEAPFGDDPFVAPAGYEKMQMPNFPE